jgi:hypothetical protein
VLERLSACTRERSLCATRVAETAKISSGMTDVAVPVEWIQDLTFPLILDTAEIAYCTTRANADATNPPSMG